MTDLGAPDRCGYRALLWQPGVEFKIYALSPVGRRDQWKILVEYRGTEPDLIAAGVVTAEFLIPRPGRKRHDAAGRWVSLQRRLEGIRVVTFHGDPFAEPRLPAISQALINEAIEERRRYNREYRARNPKLYDEMMAPEPDDIGGAEAEAATAEILKRFARS